jgi:hypothetical protein
MPSPLRHAQAGSDAIDRATHPACPLVDTHIREILGHSGSDEAIRMLMADAMSTLQWLETCTDADMDALCEHYDGLYRCATRLEQVAEGIAKGRIPVLACRATGA